MAEVEVQSGRERSGIRITLKAVATEPDAFTPGGVAVTLGERGSGETLEVVVVSVAEGSEAERAGLKAGDVLSSVDGARPKNMRDARARLNGALRTDVVVEVLRASGSERLSVLREPVRR